MRDWKHAIIIGGSIAGLFSAKVLSKFFDRVTIIERDEFPSDAKHRNGVPQGRHLHQILSGGLDLMRGFFPSIDDDLLDAGAVPIDMGGNVLLGTRYGLVEPINTGLKTYACSRIKFEHIIRGRVQDIDNVSFKTGSSVTGLVLGVNHTSAAGVYVRHKRDRRSKSIMGDLIVDASGRTSKTSAWLKELGLEVPHETFVDARVGYSTCIFEKPSYAPDGIFSLLTISDIDNPRSALILETDDNEWLAMVSSKNGDYPPNDHSGFLEFAKSCNSPLVYNYLKNAKPLTRVYGYRRTSNIWRRYEKLNSMPDNFIVTGDAVCAFNPIGGQGMSIAVLDAKILDDLLETWHRNDRTGFGQKFQAKVAKRAELAFMTASADDLQQPNVNTNLPDQSWIEKQIGLYFRRAVDVMAFDPYIRQRFLEVVNLVAPPTTLLAPDIISRVLKYIFLVDNAPQLLPKLPQKKVQNIPLNPCVKETVSSM